MTKHRQIAIDAGGADLLLRPRLAMAVAHQRQGGLVTEKGAEVARSTQLW